MILISSLSANLFDLTQMVIPQVIGIVFADFIAELNPVVTQL